MTDPLDLIVTTEADLRDRADGVLAEGLSDSAEAAKLTDEASSRVIASIFEIAFRAELGRGR